MLLNTLCSLFEEPVSGCIATPDMYVGELWLQEEICIKGAVEKRRREFTAGRAAARHAITRFCEEARPITVNQDRTPRWPPGIIGSISHCDRLCAAVVAPTTQVMSLGLDLEVAEPISDQLLRLICDPGEIAFLKALQPLQGSNWGKVVFCAKEAFYKCYYQTAGTFLDFSDVSVRISKAGKHPCGDFSVTLKNPSHCSLPSRSLLTCRWALEDGIVLAGVTLRLPQ